jgi:hypothetical protein
LAATIDSLARRASHEPATVVTLVGVGLTGVIQRFDPGSSVLTLLDRSERVAHVPLGSVDAVVIENPASLMDAPRFESLGLLELRRLAGSFDAAGPSIVLGDSVSAPEVTAEQRGAVGAAITEVVRLLADLASEPVGAAAIGELAALAFDLGAERGVTTSAGVVHVVVAATAESAADWRDLLERAL